MILSNLLNITSDVVDSFLGKRKELEKPERKNQEITTVDKRLSVEK